MWEAEQRGRVVAAGRLARVEPPAPPAASRCPQCALPGNIHRGTAAQRAQRTIAHSMLRNHWPRAKLRKKLIERPSASPAERAGSGVTSLADSRPSGPLDLSAAQGWGSAAGGLGRGSGQGRKVAERARWQERKVAAPLKGLLPSAETAAIPDHASIRSCGRAA